MPMWSIVMGGNAAEAHPCGFKWVIEAKIENAAKLVVVDPRFTRTASVADMYAPIRPGTDIAFLSGVIRYLLEKDAIQHEYVRAYTNAGLIVKEEFGFVDGLFSGYDEESRSYDKSSWDYELDEQGFAKDRRHLAEPALRDQPAAQACRSLYARNGVAHLRHAAGQVSAGLRTDRHDGGAGQGDDQPVRARLDPAFDRLPEHPHDGDGPTAARQHWRGRRRHECLARSLEHSGADRYRPAVEPDARLSQPAGRQRGDLRRLHEDAAVQAAASGPDQLLSEHAQVLRQLPEGDLRRRGARRQ